MKEGNSMETKTEKALYPVTTELFSEMKTELDEVVRERLDYLMRIFSDGRKSLSRPLLDALASEMAELLLGRPLRFVFPPETPHADIVDRFVAENCIVGVGYAVETAVFNEKLAQWCRDHEKFIPSRRAVGLRLDQHGFMATRRSNGVRFWVGLAMREG
jgi:hypothetical protein